MFNFAKWLIGFIIVIKITGHITLDFKLFCNETTNKEGDLIGDCQLAGLDEFPTHFNKSIVALDISGNSFQFQGDEFKIYPNLKSLLIKGSEVALKSLPEHLFEPLTKLEKLDLTGTKGDYKIPKALPSSIKYFFANEMHKSEQLDLTALNQLTELELAQNSFSDFPKLSKMAPLTRVDLRDNPIGNLHYTNLTPFCLLKRLLLLHSDLDRQENYDRCCGIDAWVTECSIVGTGELKCESSDNKPCSWWEGSISSEARNERYECLERHGKIIHRRWLRIALIVVALLLVAMVSYVAYKFYNAYKSGSLDFFKMNQYRSEEEHEPEIEGEPEPEDEKAD